MKLILVLDGVSPGKSVFIETLKSNNYWCWNINARNVLSMVSHKIGWSGLRNTEYYNFLQSFEELANQYFDFENWYIHDMIKKFEQNEKVQVLLIHNCKEILRKKLYEEYNNTKGILIVTENFKDDDYHYTINCKDENYIQNILDLMSNLGE